MLFSWMIAGCVETPKVTTDEALICVADCFHVPNAVVRAQCMKHCETIDDIVEFHDLTHTESIE